MMEGQCLSPQIESTWLKNGKKPLGLATSGSLSALRNSDTSQATSATSPCSFGGSSSWGCGLQESQVEDSLRDCTRSSQSCRRSSSRKKKKSKDKEGKHKGEAVGSTKKRRKSKRKSSSTSSSLIMSENVARVAAECKKADILARYGEDTCKINASDDSLFDEERQWLDEDIALVAAPSYRNKTCRIIPSSGNVFGNEMPLVQPSDTDDSVWGHDDTRWDDEESNITPKIMNLNQCSSTKQNPSLPTHKEERPVSRISSLDVLHDNTYLASDDDGSTTVCQPSGDQNDEPVLDQNHHDIAWSGPSVYDLPRCSSLTVGKRPTRRLWSLATLVLVTISAGALIGTVIGIIVYFSMDKKDNTNRSTFDEGFVSTISPSSAPTFISSEILLGAIQLSGFDALANTTSPQFRAVGWMSSVDQLDIEDFGGRKFAQRYALVVMYFSFQGEDWINQEQWLTPTVHECDWSTGISCQIDETSNLFMVVGFDATRNNLQGTIPFEIGLLTSSETFRIPKNKVQGTIPESIGAMTSLLTLEMHDNALTGSIPPSIGNACDLITLGLSKNQLSSSLPENLYNLKRLRSLVLEWNNLIGNLSQSLKQLTALTTLNLRHNQLTGTIPITLDTIGNLDIFLLDNNRLTGPIPLITTSLTRMQIISISHNQLTGNIDVAPNYIPSFDSGDLRLQHVDISSNLLSGPISPLFGFLPTLRYFDLSDNGFVGTFPSRFGWDSIEYLSAANNSLTGTIPIGHATLTHLDFSNNLLTQGIPKEICEYVDLEFLILGDNALESTIPTCLMNVPKLRDVELQNCGLVGPIAPWLGQLTDLIILDLSSNLLTSTIPSELGALTELEYLRLRENALTGSIPMQLANMMDLKTLDLGDNRLAGAFPTELAVLVELESLSTRGNEELHGEIPPGLCESGTLELLAMDIGCSITCDCCDDAATVCADSKHRN